MNLKAAWAALWAGKKDAVPGGILPPPGQSLVEFLSALGAESPAGATLEDYTRSVTLYRAATRVASDLASAPVVIEKRQGKEWAALDEDSPEFGGVAGVFKRVNPQEGATALWTRFHLSSVLLGRAALLTDYANGGNLPRGKAPKYLRAIRPDRLQSIRGRDGVLTGYRYTPDGSAPIMLRPDEVLVHYLPSPLGELCGASPADAMAIYTAIEKQLSRYQLGFFKNGARGSVVLSTDRDMTKEQADEARAGWNATNSGTENAHGLWIASGGIKVQELNGRRDTDFVDLFRILKEQGSAAMGVPPALLGDYSNAALANIEEQTKIYLEGTLYPLTRLLEENLTEIVLPRFAPNGVLRARLDWTEVPMFQRVKVTMAAAMKNLSGGAILTREEVRVALGYSEQPEVGEFPEPVDPAAGGLPFRSARPAKKAIPSRKWIDNPERDLRRVKAAGALDDQEGPAHKQLLRYVRAWEARVLARLSGTTRAVKELDDELIDEVEEAEVLEGVLVRVYTRVMRSRGPEAAAEVGGAASDFLIDAPEVQQFIRENAYKNGKRVVGTAAEQLRAAIRETAGLNATIQDIAESLRDAFDVIRSRALTVARTETVRAYNAASVQAWVATGQVEAGEWLTSHDDAVRESHAAIDGEVQQLGGLYSNGVKFPGDPDGPADETINCRCTLLPVLVDADAPGVRIAPNALDAMFNGKPLTVPEAPTHSLAAEKEITA